MKRRTFAKISGTSVVAAPFISFNFKSPPRNKGVDEIMGQLIRANDLRIPDYLKNQELNPGHQWFGGVKDGYGIFRAGSVSGFIKGLVCAYVSPTSQYFHEKSLIFPLENAASYLIKSQHEDGTIDLPSTNFHSPPDTAFVVEPLCISYNLLLSDAQTETKKLLESLQVFLQKAGDALSVGGIHTPNHRWVVSMALARINELFPNPKYVTRIDQWLGEGIDIDEDGQYHEKSTYVYTPLVNRCLITIAKLQNRPELYEPVRKNLEMSLFYRHANGEIATESSGRQDQYQKGFMEYYYYPYRYMAVHDGDKVFSAMANELESTIPEKLGFWLGYMLEDNYWLGKLPMTSTLPDDYYKVFKGSNIIRIRRGKVDASILNSNPAFFTFFNNNAAIEAVRFASAFFGKGQFVAAEWEFHGKEVLLRQEMIGPYYQPMNAEDLPEDGDWGKMSRMKRPQSEIQHQELKVIVRENDGKFELEISIEGTDNVPVAIELAFRKGGKLTGVLPSSHGIEEAYQSQTDVPIIYEFEGDKIQVDTGMQEHTWSQLRGALPKLDAMSVYLTGMTPFKTILEIKAS